MYAVAAFAVDGREEGHGSVVCLVARADEARSQNEEVGVRIASKRYRRHDPSSHTIGML